jgi:alanine racemase
MRTPYTSDTQRAWVDVDLDALVDNARTYQARVGVPLLPMVKADGYGLGAVAAARALRVVEPFGFGVATVAEAAELRRAGISQPIIAFTPLDAHQLAGHRGVAARPVIGDLAALQAWLAMTDDPFHLEIDTGMARAGFRWDDVEQLHAVAELVRGRSGWEGVFTHFHSADRSPELTAGQWQRFEAARAAIGADPPLVHAANSAAGADGSRYAAGMARPGIHLYGGVVAGFVPRPVARFRARVVAVRRLPAGESVSYDATWVSPGPTTVATVAAGYADGVHRRLSEGGLIEIGEQICPIVGRVTMDFTMVDVGSRPVQVGDVATIFGGLVSLESQAERAATISYELLTALGPRLPRCYDRVT